MLFNIIVRQYVRYQSFYTTILVTVCVSYRRTRGMRFRTQNGSTSLPLSLSFSRLTRLPYIVFLRAIFERYSIAGKSYDRPRRRIHLKREFPRNIMPARWLNNARLRALLTPERRSLAIASRDRRGANLEPSLITLSSTELYNFVAHESRFKRNLY